jgi:hypothetical protein
LPRSGVGGLQTVVGTASAGPPSLSAVHRREFQEALLKAQTFEDLPGKWQARANSAVP